jgi:hypothetical protein
MSTAELPSLMSALTSRVAATALQAMQAGRQGMQKWTRYQNDNCQLMAFSSRVRELRSYGQRNSSIHINRAFLSVRDAPESLLWLRFLGTAVGHATYYARG